MHPAKKLVLSYCCRMCCEDICAHTAWSLINGTSNYSYVYRCLYIYLLLPDRYHIYVCVCGVYDVYDVRVRGWDAGQKRKRIFKTKLN